MVKLLMEWHLYKNQFESMKHIVNIFKYIHKNEALEACLLGLFAGAFITVLGVTYLLWVY